MAQDLYESQNIGKDKRFRIDENALMPRQLDHLQTLLRGSYIIHEKLSRAECPFNPSVQMKPGNEGENFHNSALISDCGSNAHREGESARQEQVREKPGMDA
jgi:hypothetical protein